MTLNHEFTEKIQQWLDTPHEQRDYEQGALYLLKLNGNQIMYRNLMSNPRGKAEFIEYHLRKHYNFRVKDLTHAQVVAMDKQVEEIVKKHNTFTEDNPAKEFKQGKRGDHDTLPEEIQALYVENLSLLQRMREVHLKLRTLSTADAPCPDSERYPFLKELIELDTRLHANWDRYDHYTGAENEPVETVAEEKPARKTRKKK
ncbi:MAG: hypothetical protein IKY67_01810 [Paludibacteraceae bacterium]|nr:hypothetical protein [Bacteroidaceae bacterium]MBR5822861.1 hypothetical protein [Paludibacteraceae bacterium]